MAGPQPRDILRLALLVPVSGALALERAPPLLRVEPPLACAGGRRGHRARTRLAQRGGDQGAHPVASVLEIPRLIACRLARDHQSTVRVEPVTAKRPQTRARGLREPLHGVEGDAQIDLGGDLVHVLAPRARGPHGADVQGLLGHADDAVDDDRAAHPSIVSCSRSPRTAGPQPRDALWLARPSISSPPTAGPQPRDVLRLARPSINSPRAAGPPPPDAP